MTVAYLPCEFLANISPAQLMQQLVKRRETAELGLYPIWLHNDGQQVIGLWPKMVLTASPNPANQVQYLNIQQQYRPPVIRDDRDKATGIVGDRASNSDVSAQLVGDMATVLTRLITYQQQHSLEMADTSVTATSYRDGFMGYINYDIAAAHLAGTDASTDYLTPQQPLVCLGHYDIYLSYQHQQWQLHATTNQARDSLTQVQSWLTDWVTPQLSDTEFQQPLSGLTMQPRWSRTEYAQAFERVQAYLKAGDCYQINLTQCWQGQLANEQLVDYLPSLYQSTQAPFAGYVKVDGYELLSCSPELFFTFIKNPHGDNSIITKPIKGTRPRGATAASDTALKHALADSDKDKAENVMIVDLLRNDLGKYAKTGSVQVPNLFAIESFSNVHHMVSTITATLKDEVHPLTVLFDSLPAGSITGTPKKRAVEIIHELEIAPRGAYCGTLGYLNFDGTGQWNVLIRTLQACAGQVSLWAGGGVTIASECEAEYQECFDKVGNLLKILQG